MGWQTQVVPRLQAGNTIINSNGMFVYSGTPAAGNLIFSVSGSATTDEFGNTVLAGGAACYGAPGIAALFSAGAIAFQFKAGDIVNGLGGQINMLDQAELGLTSGGLTLGDNQSQVFLISSAKSGINKSQFQTNAQRSSFNNTGWANLGTAPNDTNSGTTWVSGERAFMNNNWVAYMNNIDAALNAMFLG
jgi:hypothetical protein